MDFCGIYDYQHDDDIGITIWSWNLRQYNQGHFDAQ